MNPTNDSKSVGVLKVSTMKHQLKRDQEINNPCLEEHHQSLKCLSDNDYIHEACKPYFQSYKDCQQFWKKVAIDRSRKNITPSLPPPQERLKVKNEYLKSYNVK